MKNPFSPVRRRVGSVALALIFIAACDDAKNTEVPVPKELTRENVGYYCRMIVLDHPGPKGQIFVGDQPEPLWFSSVRDTIAFTRLGEERKDVRAIYVTDMARATDWESPEAGTWTRAEEAWYVVGSDARGGMGAPEPVPFGDEEAAARFAAERGGTAMAWSDIPSEAILGSTDTGDDAGGSQAHTMPHAESPAQPSVSDHGNPKEAYQ